MNAVVPDRQMRTVERQTLANKSMTVDRVETGAPNRPGVRDQLSFASHGAYFVSAGRTRKTSAHRPS